MLDFIYNPTAGNGRGERARTAIEPLLRGVPHAFHATSKRGDATAVAAKLTEGGAEDIIAMGGDGTLHEVLNGLRDPAVTRLGLIPCGSGNDFAAAVGLPQDPEAALSVILNGEAKPTDYMVCAGVRGINAIGAGIDVDILRRYARMKLLRGSAAYLASLLITVTTYQAKCIEDVTEGTPIPHNTFIACCGNGKSFGGGIPICPDAIVDDGLLDVVIIDDIRKRAIPAAFVKLMGRKVGEIKSAHQSRRTKLKIASTVPMPVQIDGEIYEGLPFDVTLIHNGLRFYRP